MKTKTYFDLAGDGGSDILGQVAARKRRITSSLAGLKHMVAVGSGKGGVGKSTLTMLLALELQSRGFQPVILDADFNGPTQARLSGLAPRPPVPGETGMLVPKGESGIGVVSFGTIYPEPRPVEFPSAARGDSHVWRATREFSVLGDLLADTDWRPFDLLLFDLPPGAEKTFQFAEFLEHRTRFLLVTIPSQLSQGVVARSLSALERNRNGLVGFIENMNGYLCPSCRETRPLFPSRSKPDLPLTRLGGIPFDPGLAEACDRGLTHSEYERLACREAVTEACDGLLKALEDSK